MKIRVREDGARQLLLEPVETGILIEHLHLTDPDAGAADQAFIRDLLVALSKTFAVP